MLTDFSPGKPLLWGWLGWERPGRAVQGRAARDDDLQVLTLEVPSEDRELPVAAAVAMPLPHSTSAQRPAISSLRMAECVHTLALSRVPGAHFFRSHAVSMRFRQDFHLHLCLNLRMAAHCSVDRPVTTASCASKALEQSTKL